MIKRAQNENLYGTNIPYLSRETFVTAVTHVQYAHEVGTRSSSAKPDLVPFRA